MCVPSMEPSAAGCVALLRTAWMEELATPARRKEATAPGSSDAVALVVYTAKPTEQCACSDGPGIHTIYCFCSNAVLA